LLPPFWRVLVAALAVGAGQLNWTSCVGDVGFNWPNAGRVYLADLNQLSTDAEQPSRPFALASSQKIRQVRVFVGVDAALSVWQNDPEQAVEGLDRLLADAEAHNVQLIISNYPDQQMINALAGHDYPSWAAAQVELVTPGSVPFRAFEKWLEDVVPRFASDPRIAAWEVVNEPGYMLGMDNGTVDVD
jgi:endo-1,4-beta-mannosidase